MAAYYGVVALEATLPDEAVDVTVNPMHYWVLHRLFSAFVTVFGDRAVVLADVFLRVRGPGPGEAEQRSPDFLIAPGAPAHDPNRVYLVPDEPVPAVTGEILSPANYYGQGRRELEAKRELFGRIGVATHIEIDPAAGTVRVWENRGGTLEPAGPATDAYDGPALGGLRLTLDPGQVHIWLPDGREYQGAPAETARAASETARADAATAQAAAEAQRAERYRDLLLRQGIDPDPA